MAGTAQEQDLAYVILATLITNFNGCSIFQLCAMGSTIASKFTQGVAHQEIVGQGRQEGEAKGRHEGFQEGEVAMTLILLDRRCGPLSSPPLHLGKLVIRRRSSAPRWAARGDWRDQSRAHGDRLQGRRQ